ncbi:hypothetical protein E1A91_A06G172400v1 [Gossypium mustelinum]|uniref:Uncharacterized protein n=1 Tax=Gossypium mustelinum TaxID=34275 RepID=A0A5D2YXQ9_GOSMU|nr:hypothetical protein E1A91_A06G172400v1 [Gossypium mustelinum]
MQPTLLTKTNSSKNQSARVSIIHRIHHFIWWSMVYQQCPDPIHAHGDSVLGTGPTMGRTEVCVALGVGCTEVARGSRTALRVARVRLG